MLIIKKQFLEQEHINISLILHKQLVLYPIDFRFNSPIKGKDSPLFSYTWKWPSYSYWVAINIDGLTSNKLQVSFFINIS